MAAETATATVPRAIFPRLDRLDTMMSHLEELKGSRKRKSSSVASTTSSSNTSEGGGGHSSLDWSPRSFGKGCRPFEDVVVETKIKGNLITRLNHLEDHVLELSLQMEKEVEAEKKKKTEAEGPRGDEYKEAHKKRGLKSLVKSCMKGKSKATY